MNTTVSGPSHSYFGQTMQNWEMKDELGLEKTADACAGMSAAKLSWLVAWYIRDETYQKGLAERGNYQHGLPFTAYRGEGGHLVVRWPALPRGGPRSGRRLSQREVRQ